VRDGVGECSEASTSEQPALATRGGAGIPSRARHRTATGTGVPGPSCGRPIDAAGGALPGRRRSRPAPEHVPLCPT